MCSSDDGPLYRQRLKAKRSKHNRKAEIPDTRISSRVDCPCVICGYGGGMRSHQQITHQDVKKMYRQKDRNHKVAFLTQHIPDNLPEIIDFDLSVLEEPMEKFL